MWLIRSSFFLFYFYFIFIFFLIIKKKKKRKRKKKCHVTKIRFLHQIIECLFWLIWANTIMINVCIYQKNGKVETWLSSQSKKKKKKKMIISGCLFSKRFVRLSFQKANLLYLTLSFISRIIAPCVNFNQNRDETTSG